MSRASRTSEPQRPAGAARLVGVGDHPRAAAGIARAKSLGGLAAFALVGAASLANGEPPLGSLVRAVLGGVVCYLVAWAAAVAVWRHLLVAEARGAVRRRAAPRRGSEAA